MALNRSPGVIRATEQLIDESGKPTRDAFLSITEIWRQIVAGFVIVPCAASGTNDITLTPILHKEGAATYGDYMTFAAAAAQNSTGAVTAHLESVDRALPTLKVYVNGGAAQANAGDIVVGSLYLFIYNSALDGGAGGFVIK